MAKYNLTINKKEQPGIQYTEEIKNFYVNKYFSLWSSTFTIKGLNEQQEFFIKRLLWANGTVCCFNKIKDFDVMSGNYLGWDVTTDGLFFSSYGVNGIDIYNYPIWINPIAVRGGEFFPNQLRVGEDCVLLYANNSHTSIIQRVHPLITALVETEVAIRMNRFAQRVPMLISVTPENEQAVSELINKISNGDTQVFATTDTIGAIQDVAYASNSYTIDRLYTYKSQLESELKTLLGIENLFTIKKERLITSEIDASQQDTAFNRSAMIDTLRTGIEQINSLFGTSLELSDCQSIKDEKDEVEVQHENLMNRGNLVEDEAY